jgi:hypothetical protein
LVGIAALNNSDGNWLVYPNSASGILHVRNASAAAEGSTQLELMNAMGPVLYREQVTGAAKSFDLSAYANGVYFVKLVSE